MTGLEPRRLAFADLARVASVGIRTRRVRASLSALGIALGVAAIVAVLGLSASSQAGLLAEIDRLGTNLLTVQTGQTLTGDQAELPLAVTVTDRYGNRVAGAHVTFSAPSRGASGSFERGRTVSVRTNATGIAVAPPFTASASVGGYLVRAFVKGTAAHGSFALANTPGP